MQIFKPVFLGNLPAIIFLLRTVSYVKLAEKNVLCYSKIQNSTPFGRYEPKTANFSKKIGPATPVFGHFLLNGGSNQKILLHRLTFSRDFTVTLRLPSTFYTTWAHKGQKVKIFEKSVFCPKTQFFTNNMVPKFSPFSIVNMGHLPKLRKLNYLKQIFCQSQKTWFFGKIDRTKMLITRSDVEIQSGDAYFLNAS